MEQRPRLSRCRELMQEKSVDLLVISPGNEMFYFSGYRGQARRKASLLAIPRGEEAFFAVPEINVSDVSEASSIGTVLGYSSDDSAAEVIRGEVSDVSTVAVDDRMPVMFEYPLRESFEDCEFMLGGMITNKLRELKDEDEIESLEESAEIVDQVVEDVREDKERFVGKSEAFLESFIQGKMKEYGSEEEAFPTIVASGANCAKPHHTPGEKILQEDEAVMLDFGGKVDGYVADQTRTIVLDGKPSEKFRDIFETVREAQEEVIEKVGPGVSIGEIDEAARKVLRREGLEENFPHKIGHGVGLEIHEDPVLRPESDRKVKEGMVFSIEPGVYLEDEFGVRIEDVVVVESDGVRRLNTSSRNWR